MIIEYSEITGQIIQIYKSGLIHALFWCVFFDILTGILKSFKKGETSSTVSLFGIAKHALVVLLIFVLNVYLPLFGFAIYAQGFTLWMIITYLISLTENWGQLGLPLPEVVSSSLIKLKKTTEKSIHIDADVLKIEEKEQKKEEK
ncbi:phage holin family protein [Marinilactibacillus kalidii]|uniref:phage holin family protein n=1 Tax=Marinilactibacillus kalidii TaxID=2820274 RepID=UPI001ABE43DF|nr:phage holin family protein [Marinilactibacillus kalidii]